MSSETTENMAHGKQYILKQFVEKLLAFCGLAAQFSPERLEEFPRKIPIKLLGFQWENTKIKKRILARFPRRTSVRVSRSTSGNILVGTLENFPE